MRNIMWGLATDVDIINFALVGAMEYIILLSVYSPCSDRVGLPLHNIPSQFISVISSPSPHHMSIPFQPTTSNDSCDRLNSNQHSQFYILLEFHLNWAKVAFSFIVVDWRRTII